VKSFLGRFTIALSVALATALCLTPASYASKYARITEVNSDNWSTVATVSGKLPWNSKTFSNAKSVLKLLEKNLNSQLAALRAAGAVRLRIETKKPEWDKFWFTSTKNRWAKIRYVGLDAYSKIVAVTPWDPETNVFYARHLVHLNSTDCSLRGFSLFDPSTWFENRCGVVSTSTERILALALEELLAQGTRDLPRIVAHDLKRLDYALVHMLACEQVGDILTCAELGVLTGNPGADSVNLRSVYGGWDYTISVDLASRTASIHYLKPRPGVFAKNIDWKLSDFLEGGTSATKLIIP
jgi:hypothetical protein